MPYRYGEGLSFTPLPHRGGSMKKPFSEQRLEIILFVLGELNGCPHNLNAIAEAVTT